MSIVPEDLRPARLLSLTFNQPLGTELDAGGYHLDLRVKAGHEPVWPPPGLAPLERMLWVVIAQWGLGAFERFVVSGDERWLVAARGAGEHVLAGMCDGGPLDGALRHGFAYPHTFSLEPGWVSAMAQGEAASLLVRLHRQGGDDRFAEAAVRLLQVISVPSGRGGCGTPWRGGWWPEEYPTDPPSLVLNGAIFALLGMHDVARVQGSESVVAALEGSLELLAANLGAWDLGWWSRYDLYPFARPNIASLAYQELHESLLEALDRAEPHPEFSRYAQRFAAQRSSLVGNGRAFAAKVAFRLAVPRG
jgi:hypothetical protein